MKTKRFLSSSFSNAGPIVGSVLLMMTISSCSFNDGNNRPWFASSKEKPQEKFLVRRIPIDNKGGGGVLFKTLPENRRPVAQKGIIIPKEFQPLNPINPIEQTMSPVPPMQQGTTYPDPMGQMGGNTPPFPMPPATPYSSNQGGNLSMPAGGGFERYRPEQPKEQSSFFGRMFDRLMGRNSEDVSRKMPSGQFDSMPDRSPYGDISPNYPEYNNTMPAPIPDWNQERDNPLMGNVPQPSQPSWERGDRGIPSYENRPSFSAPNKPVNIPTMPQSDKASDVPAFVYQDKENAQQSPVPSSEMPSLSAPNFPLPSVPFGTQRLDQQPEQRPMPNRFMDESLKAPMPKQLKTYPQPLIPNIKDDARGVERTNDAVDNTIPSFMREEMGSRWNEFQGDLGSPVTETPAFVIEREKEDDTPLPIINYRRGQLNKPTTKKEVAPSVPQEQRSEIKQFNSVPEKKATTIATIAPPPTAPIITSRTPPLVAVRKETPKASALRADSRQSNRVAANSAQANKAPLSLLQYNRKVSVDKQDGLQPEVQQEVAIGQPPEAIIRYRKNIEQSNNRAVTPYPNRQPGTVISKQQLQAIRSDQPLQEQPGRVSPSALSLNRPTNILANYPEVATVPTPPANKRSLVQAQRQIDQMMLERQQLLQQIEQLKQQQ